ncbi:putative nuclease HARBI1 [Mya arenaria]|uniref:putative nuclease HARBI1 n=2 Tax=Mya arenaria TaxID=6604 RepID=UPI0022DF7077|nr:putative nuclease HARBI1 [Mya arenaria]
MADRQLDRYYRYRRFRLPRRPRVFTDRNNPLEILDVESVRKRYRFFPDSIMILVGIVEPTIGTATMRSNPLPPLLTVLCCLQFFATGAHHIVIAQAHGVSRSAVGKAIHAVSVILAGLLNRYVKFPTGLEIESVKRKFYSVAGFPNVVGAVDGTHVKIQAPPDNEADYVNRKGYHSLNVQMVCDANYRITDVIAKWPGSVHDSRMFSEGILCQKLETGQIDGLLLGDSGYPCRKYLMTPYANPRNLSEERFNTALCRTRVLIEQTFGMLKRRFAVLKYGIRTTPDRAAVYVASCAMLHNFGFEHGDVYGRQTYEDDDMPQVDNQGVDVNGRTQRDYITQRHFAV